MISNYELMQAGLTIFIISLSACLISTLPEEFYRFRLYRKILKTFDEQKITRVLKRLEEIEDSDI